jgi:antitoxin component YwqK of YwqJK toxin-antitoxin module
MSVSKQLNPGFGGTLVETRVCHVQDGMLVRTELREGRSTTVQHFEKGMHVRSTFCKAHARYGEILYHEGGKHVRTEFAEDHSRHGEIQFLENGKPSRLEHAEGHPQHGEIRFFEDGKFVRLEHAEGHPQHGEIQFFEDAKHVRTEFGEGHAKHLTIEFMDHGDHFRTEYAEGHEDHGVIEFLKDFSWDSHTEKVVYRTEYAEGHEDHGVIKFYESLRSTCKTPRRIHRLVCTEFTKGHPRAGHVDYYDWRRKHVRTEFAKWHPRFGHVDHYENDEHVRTEVPQKRQRDEEDERIIKRFKNLEETLICPITNNIPEEPVMAEDGFIYERAVIQRWLKYKSHSPMTNEEMGTKIIPSTQLRNVVQMVIDASHTFQTR